MNEQATTPAQSAQSLRKLYAAYATAYAYLAAEPDRRAEALGEVERKTSAPRLDDLNGIPQDSCKVFRYPDKESAAVAGRRLHSYANYYLRPGGERIRFIKEQSLVEGVLVFVFRLPA